MSVTSFKVPRNQAVSWAVYVPSVISAAGVTADEYKSHSFCVSRAYENGEPISMAADELRFRVSMNRNRLRNNNMAACVCRIKGHS